MGFSSARRPACHDMMSHCHASMDSTQCEWGAYARCSTATCCFGCPFAAVGNRRHMAGCLTRTYSIDSLARLTDGSTELIHSTTQGRHGESVHLSRDGGSVVRVQRNARYCGGSVRSCKHVKWTDTHVVHCYRKGSMNREVFHLVHSRGVW